MMTVLLWGLALSLCALANLLGKRLGLIPIVSQAVRLAVPSFLLPFACGMACAVWPMGLSGVAALALGLVFAITAIPGLYLYLRATDYPAPASRRLLQATILMPALAGLHRLPLNSQPMARSPHATR